MLTEGRRQTMEYRRRALRSYLASPAAAELFHVKLSYWKAIVDDLARLEAELDCPMVVVMHDD